MNTEDVEAYLTGPFQQIAGWCGPHLWQVIQPLASTMIKDEKAAPVAEIGIHHGKFFIGLVKTMGSSENNYAIDVFDLQQFNMDESGKGNLEKFCDNLRLSAIPASAVEIVRTDSLSLSDRDISKIQETVGGFSLFSIDGGHTDVHTINDLEIAIRLTRSSGIIFIDDYNNPQWPGVQEGVARYYFTRYPKFVPLVYASNKLILCHLSYHMYYLKIVEDFLKNNFPSTRQKRVRRFGHEGLTVHPNLTEAVYVVR